MNSTLVVFHSRSGHTRRVAKALAESLDADLDEIVVHRRRDGPLGYLRCALEGLGGWAASVRATRHDPSRYERVLIGTPVWFWSLSSPVRAWVQSHHFGDAKLAFFCTMGGSGAEHAFEQLESVCGRAPQTTLALSEAQLAGDFQGALADFVAKLQEPPARAELATRAAPRKRRATARAA
jgi:menaquinone-dependent protoporphyrinogen IX oxidase